MYDIEKDVENVADAIREYLPSFGYHPDDKTGVIRALLLSRDMAIAALNASDAVKQLKLAEERIKVDLMR